MCSFNLDFSFPPNNYIDELNGNMVVKWNEIKNGHTWGSPNADRFILAEKSGYIPTVKSFPSLFCFMTQCEQSDPLSYSLVIQSEPLPKSQSRLSYFLFQIGATTKKYIFLFSQPYCLSIRQFNCLEERKSREAHVVQIILYAKPP